MSDESKLKFPIRLKLKQHCPVHGDWLWKSLCIVYDNEALGILTRLLDAADMEYREEST